MKKSVSNQFDQSRRKFLVASGGVTLFISGYVMLPRIKGESDPDDLAPQQVTAWVNIGTKL